MLVSFAYAFHVVALYPLLKFVIALLITLPLCFLISSTFLCRSGFCRHRVGHLQ